VAVNSLITHSHFLEVLRDYGGFASWAVWKDRGTTATAGVSDLSIFQQPELANTLRVLRSDIAFVGLNVSRIPEDCPLSNFHDKKPTGTDYKLRDALVGTQLWGAYMTDFVKDFPEPKSSALMRFLKSAPEAESFHASTLRSELTAVCGDLSAVSLVALGADAHKLLKKHFQGCNIFHLDHYAQRRYGAAEYRARALILESQLSESL
jgi:hypothetical protein